MDRIKALNKILIEAIEHGGDPGGPYFCNYENLRDSLRSWLKVNNLSGQYKVSEGHYCLIVPIDGPDYGGSEYEDWKKEEEFVEEAYKYRISGDNWDDIF